MERRSLRITHISWGRTVVEGLGEGKDFKLYPGGGRDWNWNETGTRHTPGIQPADIQELLDNGCETIVLSRGMRSLLQTCPETLNLLMEAGVEIYMEETMAAVQRYNAMVGIIPIGALIHSTC
ncbi:MTH938/NDUFAF3 family protein [Nonomuraea sp. NPDC047529]|uniref:Mth938-like domain-containing protein n=1 Tax=Nonomuraea sp. NPDC047529 TaxID=3155623 RepID=UPI0033C6B8BE